MADPRPDRPDRPERGEVLLRSLLVVLGMSGTVLLFGYESDNAVLGGFSWKYIVGVVLPYLGFLVFLGFGRTVFGATPPRPVCLLTAGIGICLAAVCPEPRVAVAIFVLAAGSSVICWNRRSESARLLWISIPPAMLACVLFLGEIPGALDNRPLLRWGDSDCFAYGDFPESPPFIGPGGRFLPNLDALMDAPEYPNGARVITNGEGFRNRRDFPALADSQTTRILNLGDSFTIGFCADQDEFFGPMLAAKLGEDFEVLNAEISDPAYGLHYLQQYGLALSPGLVLYGLCANDAMQSFWFAGENRRFVVREGRITANAEFTGDPVPFFEHYRDFAYRQTRTGTTGTRPHPLAGILRALARFRLLSGLRDASLRLDSGPTVTRGFCEAIQEQDGRLRLLDGTANLGRYLTPAPEIIEAMERVQHDLLLAMATRVSLAGGRFIVVLLPQRYQVHPEDWQVMCRYWNLDEADFDLELPNRRLADFCTENEIEYVDLLTDFREHAAGEKLYLPGGDVHFNRRGHDLAAGGVANYLRRN